MAAQHLISTQAKEDKARYDAALKAAGVLTKAEKKAQKKEQQKADLADSAQFKNFDKVVVAELHFDDDDEANA